MNVIKSYSRRDSATALLRKMGVEKVDYNKFIAVVDIVAGSHVVGVEYHVDVTAAEGHVAQIKPDMLDHGQDVQPEPTVEPEAIPKSPVAEPKATKKVVEPTKTAEEMTVSDVARTMILAGKTNKEVWATIKAQFNLDDSKKSYPSWYRCELKRKGQL